MDGTERIVEGCRRAVSSVDPEAREALVKAILSRRKVFVYGSGRSGLVGQMFAVRLVQLGIDVHFVGEMTTPIIGRDDLTLLISYTGKTSSVVQTAQIARRIGSEVICVTGAWKCPLVNTSNTCIVLEVPEDAETRASAPLGTIFEDSVLLFFDGIVSDVMEREGVTESEMRERHAIWVRSLLHQGRRCSARIPRHDVDGQAAVLRVYDHEYSFAARAADLGDHAVVRGGPAGAEEHPRLRLPRAE